ncbi:kinase-like domain-containing protein [Thelephora terrestris]|uniref:Kinase-like domain-containing protein n=1 Tax=Thelephora terrestris TaxID=56493 RepID=A0A9P6HM22_9AGAM|nr:kinase-like domain-containing protein [Thelephora terrestris]
MVKDFRRLWQDVTSATDEAGAVRALAEILTEKEGRSFISSLERSDAEFCFDILDRGITGYDLKTRERQAFFVTLRRLAGSHGRLPDSMIIPEKIEIEDKIIASGGVAPTDNLQKLRKQFCKEVVLWSSLSHPHVLKFRGIYGDMERGQFTTVSEWMAHGGIMNYIEENHVNRLELLHGAAQGLNYLHDVGLVHGDLKGANILMSNDTPPCACLADFGFMTMVLDPSQPMSCSVQLEGGTTMFMPPELLVPSRFGIKNPIPTPEADVYAFGLVIFQVLTGEMPFRGVRATELAFNLVQGLRPDKPANAPTIGFSDSLWTFVQQCWHGDRNSRPRVVEVVEHLAEAAANWHGLMPPFDKTENGACISSETIPYAAMCVEPQSVVLESPANSQTAESSSYLCLQSTVLTEPPQQEPWETVIKPPTEPPVDCWGAMERRSQEPSDDLPEFRHVAQNHWPPPSAIPPPKRISFREFKAKFRQFFGCIEPQSPLRIVYKKSNSGEFSAGIKGVFEDLNDPDIPLPKPSARSNPTGVMDLGGLVLSSNPVPLELVETNDESQAQEFIDRLLDVVCHSAISSMDWPPHGSQADSGPSFLNPWSLIAIIGSIYHLSISLFLRDNTRGHHSYF